MQGFSSFFGDDFDPFEQFNSFFKNDPFFNDFGNTSPFSTQGVRGNSGGNTMSSRMGMNMGMQMGFNDEFFAP